MFSISWMSASTVIASGSGLSAPVVAIELAAETDAPIDAPERDAQLGSNVLERGLYQFRQMTMLVGVEVRRLATYKHSKTVELTPQVLRRPSLHHGGGPRRSSSREPGNPPASNLDVQPKPEARSLPRQVRSLDRRRALHHKACARNDALVVGVEYPPVDALTEAEIVGIDDEVAHGHNNGAAGRAGRFLP